jgi:hypothetical protein
MSETVSMTNEKKTTDSEISIGEKKSDLIHLLDSEIDFAKNEIQQSGWTKWAIYGGLATLLWILFNELEKGGITLEILYLLLLIILFLTELRFVIGSVIPISEDEETERFINTSIISKNRLVLLLMVLPVILALFAISYLSNFVGMFVAILTYVINGWFIFCILFMLVLSFKEFPLPSNTKKLKWYTRIAPALMSFALIYVLYTLLEIVIGHSTLLAHIRIAGLISVIYYLLYLINRVSTGSPLLDSLINIRRKYSLGYLDYKQAAEQTDIALTGMRISNFLQGYIVEILSLFDEFYPKIQKISIQLRAIEKINEESQEQFLEEDKIAAESIRSSIVSLLQEIREITQEKIPAVLKSYYSRIRLINTYTKIALSEIDEINSIIDSAIQKAEEELERLLKQAERNSHLPL